MGEEVEELVTKLRDLGQSCFGHGAQHNCDHCEEVIDCALLREAADTIESLRASLTRVEEERDAERKAILEAIGEERLIDETGDESDIGYNQAINHVLGAVRDVLSRAAVEPGK